MTTILLLLAPLCEAQAPSALLVGNSYTAQNGLALRLEERAQADVPDWSSLTVDSITTGGKDLPGHLRDADGTQGDTPLRAALVTGEATYAVVTLQDQSQIPGFPQDGSTWLASRDAAVELSGMVHEHGADPWFFLTWGRRDGDTLNPELYPDYPTMQDRLTEGYLAYRDAAREAHPQASIHILPVGEVFRAVWQSDIDSGLDPATPDTLFHRLYSNDGSHPSATGTFVISGTFLASMTGRRPSPQEGLVELGLELTTQEILTDTVSEVVLHQPLDGDFDMPWVLPWDNWTGPIHGNLIRPFVWLDDNRETDALEVDDGRLWLGPDAVLTTDNAQVLPLGEVIQYGAVYANSIEVLGRWDWQAGELQTLSWTGPLTGDEDATLILPTTGTMEVDGSVNLDGSTLQFSGVLEPGSEQLVLVAADVTLIDVVWDLPEGVDAVVESDRISLLRANENTEDVESTQCGCTSTPLRSVLWAGLIPLLFRRRRVQP